jgi:hypothetical protein
MSDNNVSIGGSINASGPVTIGAGNKISISESKSRNNLTSSGALSYDDLIDELQQLKSKLSEAHELPKDTADDLKCDFEETIKAAQKDPPNKTRMIDKLSMVQKGIEGAASSVISQSIGKSVVEILKQLNLPHS